MIEVMPAQNHWECPPVLISYSSKVCQCFHTTLCWPKMWNGEATWSCMDLLCVASCPLATQSETAGASWWSIWHGGKLVGTDSWGCAKWRKSKSGGWLIITPDGTAKEEALHFFDKSSVPIVLGWLLMWGDFRFPFMAPGWLFSSSQQQTLCSHLSSHLYGVDCTLGASSMAEDIPITDKHNLPNIVKNVGSISIGESLY